MNHNSGTSERAAKRRHLAHLRFAEAERDPRLAQSGEASKVVDQRKRLMGWASASYGVTLLGRWLLPRTAACHAIEVAALVVGVLLYAQVIRLRLKEERAVWLPTDPRTVARSAIAREGILLLLMLVVVALLITAA